MLEKILTPDDLKLLTEEDLIKLSSEIRIRIIDVLSKIGGHLSSNLGSIELTVAMHYVFSSPSDKFLFDTSHQTYTHKILTGRNDQLPSIRQHEGLSGFADPTESEHDHFYAGHAGTALSLAMGLAKARDLCDEDHWIVPVLGDAALTCGLTLEALNNLPKDLSKFLVIINDNAMSISKNVGNITNILSRFINNPTANRFYKDIETLLAKIPGYGETISQSGSRIKESVKNLVSTAPFFEQYGLTYTGPIDGHDIPQLVQTFEMIKETEGPAVVHLLTTKGKGMTLASENPTTYHGVKPFDKLTGSFLAKKGPTTFPKIFGDQIFTMAKDDESIVTITPAMPAGSCLQPFMDTYPNRCIDVGIAEGHSVTYAGGIAKNPNLKVCSSIYATFSQRALDNIFHDVCIQNLPVVFAFDRSGIAGGDGATHNGIYEIGFLSNMPNLILCQPRDGQKLRELVNVSFNWKQPTIIRYPNLPTQDSPIENVPQIGTADVLKKGDTMAILGLGHTVFTALEVAEQLNQQCGITPTVVDPVFIKPLDEELLHSLCSTHQYIVTIEEHVLHAGFGSLINTFILQHGYKNDVHNIGLPDTLIEHGTHGKLTEEFHLTPKDILDTLQKRFLLQAVSHV